ncbi:phospholipase ABHD3-like [Crassostrea virginica]|uniref:Phospholipase ABHD3 n=1 Tax=Crassostrea virginica TaxID=6565 RepID=A0A8B8EET3_CRAVI|nr:phospholipase ABHD3-like [Crassostrea virginica]
MEEVQATSSFFEQISSFSIVVFFVISYLTYYFLFVVKKPRLACRDEKFKNFLLDNCPILHEKFKPTIWCFESRAQTIIRAIVKSSPKVSYESELVVLPDGGQLLLDWFDNNSSEYKDVRTRPTIILLPGLTGTSNESYITHLVHQAAQHGYRSVVYHNRGMGAQLLTPKTYCASNVDDLTYVVNLLKDRFPEAPFIGAGISLGGMMLFNYLAKLGENCKLEAGMCISVAWNVFESVLEIEKPGLNRHVLNRTLAKGLVSHVKSNMALFDKHLDDIDQVLQSSTIREFDSRFTAKMFGYSSCDDYYHAATLHNKIHALKVPVLVLSAEDDPFSPSHAIPAEEAEQNDNIAIVITSHGGHIGFMEGLFPRHEGYMDRLFSQYVKAVFTHGPQHLKQD